MVNIIERIRLVPTLAVLALAFGSSQAIAADAGKGDDRHGWWSIPNTVEVLLETNGAEALVGAVLYVEDADILDFSLVDFLIGNRKTPNLIGNNHQTPPSARGCLAAVGQFREQLTDSERNVAGSYLHSAQTSGW